MPKAATLYFVRYSLPSDPGNYHNEGPREDKAAAMAAGQDYFEQGCHTKVVDERGSIIHEFL